MIYKYFNYLISTNLLYLILSKYSKKEFISMKKMEEYFAHGRIRTPDPKLRRLVLYPAELRAHF